MPELELTDEQWEAFQRRLKKEKLKLVSDEEPKPWKDGDPERRGKKDRRKPAKKSGGFWE